MDALLQSGSFPIFAIIGVLALILIVAAVVLMSRSGNRDVDNRLSTFAGRGPQGPTDPQASAKVALAKIDAVVSKSKRGGDLARDLARADLKMTVAEFFGMKILTALIGGAIGAFVGRANPAAIFLAALVGGVVFSFLPNMYISNRAKGRIKSFNNQLGDTITMMANALRGGYSFLQTLQMVGNEAPEPISGEFRRVVQDVGLGRTTEEALQGLLRRMPSDDLDLLITAVNIQQEVGGNLAQILDTIGHTIRERVRLKGEVQTLTAQGRISAYVITALPIGLALFISVINPDYMAPIFTFGMPPKAWCCLPVASLTMIGIGFAAILKIVDIEI